MTPDEVKTILTRAMRSEFWEDRLFSEAFDLNVLSDELGLLENNKLKVELEKIIMECLTK